MPKVLCERVGSKFQDGPDLWRVGLKYDLDLEIEAFGEVLSVALEKLSKQVKGLEQQERLSRAVREAEVAL